MISTVGATDAVTDPPARRPLPRPVRGAVRFEGVTFRYPTRPEVSALHEFSLAFAVNAIGFFGATLMPATLALLRTIFLDRQQRRLAVAIWATAFSGTPSSSASPLLICRVPRPIDTATPSMAAYEIDRVSR